MILRVGESCLSVGQESNRSEKNGVLFPWSKCSAAVAAAEQLTVIQCYINFSINSGAVKYEAFKHCKVAAWFLFFYMAAVYLHATAIIWVITVITF